MKMKNNGFKLKWKKRLKFRHIYALVLLGITAFFAWHIIDLLVFTPMRAAGTMILGSRMEEIELLEESWLTDTETFGATVDDVDEVTVFWNQGPVVFLSVRVEPGTSRRDARAASNVVAGHFVEISGGIAEQYDIQVVAFYGDISEQVEENEAALLLHVHEYHHYLVEKIVAHAERYPSDYNVNRAFENIDVFNESITIAAGEGEAALMRQRLDALDVVVEYGVVFGEDEDFEPLPRLPRTLYQTPRSNIVRFPIWGTWNNDRSRISWSP